MAAIEGPTEGSAEKHSSQDEKVNDASGDVVMEDNKDGRLYSPRLLQFSRFISLMAPPGLKEKQYNNP